MANSVKAADRDIRADSRGGKQKIRPVSPATARLEKRANDEKIIRTIKIIFAAAVIVAALGTAAGLFLYLYVPPVAHVGGQAVRQYEFKYFLGEAKMTMVSQLGYTEPLDGDNAFWQSNINGEKAIDVAKKTAMDNAQEMKIHLAKAKEQGLALTEDEKANANSVVESLESNAQAQFGQSAGEYLQTYYGITQSEYSKIIQSLFLSNSVTSGLMDATEVSDEQSREYYDSHVGDFEEATVRRILFSFEGTEENARAQEESQALANETLERVNAGEDMTGLALDLSEEPGVTENSGEYSFYRDGMSVSGQLEQGFVDWAFEDGRQVGDAGVVELSGGYYVLKLENKTTDSFEDRHDSIVQSIKEEQYRATVDEWVADPQYAVTLSDKVYEGIS